MPRKEGAKNRQKSVAELLTQVAELAQKEGKKFNYNFADGEGKVVEENRAITNKTVEIFNLEEDEDSEDTYECGQCHASLSEAATKCPSCGAKLSWNMG